jgi:transcriptional regulator with XRE-family HTH domain
MASNESRPVNPNPSKLSTGSQIRAGRALLGWRRTDLATATGLHRNSIARWENCARLPRQEPFACTKIRAALLSAGVVTIATPAPGVCLVKAPARSAAKSGSTPADSAPDRDEPSAKFNRATGGRAMCTGHSQHAVSTGEEQTSRSTCIEGDPRLATCEAAE